MIASASAEVVFFAVKSALRLGEQVRRAYVEGTRAREVTLPLPDFVPDENQIAAFNYFLAKLDRNDALPTRLRVLVDSCRERNGDLPHDERREFLLYYTECQLEDHYRSADPATLKPGVLPAEAYRSLTSIRQWQRGAEPHPTALQRVAGTLVEITVDYYAGGPGRISEDTREGRALLAVLSGIDDIEFSTVPLGRLPERLVIAALETIEANPDIATGDQNVQALIRVTAAGLGNAVRRKIEQIRRERAEGDIVAETRVGEWAELVFRSLLATAGREVVAAPERFLGTAPGGHSALVSGVGGALLDFVLAQEEGQMGAAQSAEALEVVAHAAVGVVSRHPELIVDSGKSGLAALLRDVAAGIAARDRVLSADTAPEVLRLVLEKTGEHLPLIWPGAAKRPEENLALVAAQKTLEALSLRGADGEWAPQLGRDEMLSVVETVLDELAGNPGWLISAANDIDASLAAALTASVEVLRARGQDRISGETFADILRAAIRAVALRQEFLERVGPDDKLLVAVVLDDLLNLALATDEPDVKRRSAVVWRLLRRETIEGLAIITLDELSEARLNAQTADALKAFLRNQLTRIAGGEPWSLESYREALRRVLV